MLTQIEIDGFKTFKDFKVELAPFQVIVGPNGSGKSNLFDALKLLSRHQPMGEKIRLERLKQVPSYIQFVEDLTETLINLNLIRRVDR